MRPFSLLSPGYVGSLSGRINIPMPASLAAKWGAIAPSLVVQRSGNTYYHNLDPADYVVTGITKHRYADAVIGNDANSGLTPEQAVRTWTRIAEVIGSLTDQRVHVHLLSPGVYPVQTSYTMSAPFNVTADGQAGRYDIAPKGRSGTEFVLDSGATYKLAGFLATYVYDHGTLTTRGNPSKLVTAASKAECEATAGTLFVDATDTYIHLAADRPPDANVVAIATGVNTPLVVRHQCYLKGLTLYGNTKGFASGTMLDDTVGNVLDGCTCIGGSSYAVGYVRQNGFVWLNECRSCHAGADGNNYHGSGAGSAFRVIETDGISSQNASAVSDNASTVHDGICAVRINCRYYDSPRPIHDIGAGGESWNLGCLAADGSASCWRVGDDTGFAMWLDGCSVAGTPSEDKFVVVGSADAMRYRNMTIDPGDVTNAGTFEAY